MVRHAMGESRDTRIAHALTSDASTGLSRNVPKHGETQGPTGEKACENQTIEGIKTHRRTCMLTLADDELDFLEPACFIPPDTSREKVSNSVFLVLGRTMR